MPLPKLLAGLLLTATFATNANAALESRLNGQAVYDTDLNVTWLANANLAATNTFGVSGIDPWGLMTWTAAQSWIGAMNAADYLGYNDWELPTTRQPDASCSIQLGGVSYGNGCTGSEMGHLFYSELGGVADTSIVAIHNANYSLFNNVQNNLYWSRTAYAPNPALAWNFDMARDYQGYSGKATMGFCAWAVRPGDVAAVPEPETWGMMLAGLVLVGAMTKQRLR